MEKHLFMENESTEALFVSDEINGFLPYLIILMHL